MTEKNPLNNISPKTYGMPATDAELGQLIGELAESKPRAIIIDFFQAVIVVHPQSVGGKPKLTADSIPYLLANFDIKMIDGEYEIDTLDEVLEEHKLSHCTVALNPEHGQTNFKREIIWSTIINQIALVIQQKTDLSDWKIYGLQIIKKTQ
jgi:hypothetical protein